MVEIIFAVILILGTYNLTQTIQTLDKCQTKVDQEKS